MKYQYTSCSAWISLNIITSLCLFLLTFSSSSASSCYPIRSDSLGWTYPTGDVILRKGEPLELYCTINVTNAKAENFTIDNLVFEKNNELVDSRYITRINETTIRLKIENEEESEHMYYCYLIAYKNSKTNLAPVNNEIGVSVSSLEAIGTNASNVSKSLVCMNMVAVGSDPKEVENITCISLNWQALKCKWDVPKNYVKTNYTIKYMPRHRNEREASVCPNDEDVKNNSCTWTLTTKPPYRRQFEQLKITINGTNKFNATEQSINFQHYAHVLPKGPRDLKLVNKTTGSILLQWNIDDMQYFPKNWTYKILYTCNNSGWVEYMCESKSIVKHGGSISCNVTDLIPNTLYNFRVYMRTSVATGDKYWSENFASQVFRTKPRAPARSPKTDVGSFEIEDGSSQSVRTVYIYWQPLRSVEHFADNFEYRITAFAVDENGNRSPATDAFRKSINYSFAKYEIGASAYLFTILSANAEGAAPNASSVLVPAVHSKVEPCASFAKLDYGDNVYQVSWQPPVNIWDISDYTIFWCQTERERPYQCDGYTDWTHLPANETKRNFSISSSDSYQFAISANTRHSSSGMLWATCTVPHGHLGTIKQIYITQVGATFINVAWKLECWDQASTIIGFKVHYCATATANETACAGTERSTVWPGNVHRTSGNLTGLRPYTYYRANVRMFTADREGAPSAATILRTLDGAPLVEGLRIWVANRTNVSAVVRWQRPKVMNGEFQEFRVRWHRQSDESTAQAVSVPAAVELALSNLTSYTEYNVSVRACTSVCSEPMKSIVFRTRIGLPDPPVIIASPNLRSPVGGEVRWNPPANVAGPRPVYDFAVQRGEEVVMRKNLINETHVTVSLPECNNEEGPAYYSLMVRAINVDDEPGDDDYGNGSAAIYAPALHHVGPWSKTYDNCSQAGSSTKWKILALIIFPLFFSVVVFVCGRKGFDKCRQMKKVSVTVPIKFALSEMTLPSDAKVHEQFESYAVVPPIRPADEFSNLVEPTAEHAV